MGPATPDGQHQLLVLALSRGSCDASTAAVKATEREIAEHSVSNPVIGLALNAGRRDIWLEIVPRRGRHRQRMRLENGGPGAPVTKVIACMELAGGPPRRRGMPVLPQIQATPPPSAPHVPSVRVLGDCIRPLPASQGERKQKMKAQRASGASSNRFAALAESVKGVKFGGCVDACCNSIVDTRIDMDTVPTYDRRMHADGDSSGVGVESDCTAEGRGAGSQIFGGIVEVPGSSNTNSGVSAGSRSSGGAAVELVKDAGSQSPGGDAEVPVGSDAFYNSMVVGAVDAAVVNHGNGDACDIDNIQTNACNGTHTANRRRKMVWADEADDKRWIQNMQTGVRGAVMVGRNRWNRSTVQPNDTATKHNRSNAVMGTDDNDDDGIIDIQRLAPGAADPQVKGNV